MKTIRVLAVGTLALVVVNFVFRAVVSSCNGAGCDAYVPFSLLIPLLILGMTAITGVASSLRARPDGAWFPIVLTSAVIGVIGPPVALALFRDQPDRFVLAGTALILVTPIVALVYSVSARPSPAPTRD